MIKAFWDFSIGLVAFIALIGFLPTMVERLDRDATIGSTVAIMAYVALTIFAIGVPAFRLGVAAEHILLPGKRNANSH